MAAAASTSSGAVEESVVNWIVDKFKCPICVDMPGVEIYQCRNGHIICHRCQTKVEICPQCRVPFLVQGSLIRVRAVESLLDSVTMLCPYNVQGCKDRIIKKDLHNHAINCIFNGKSIHLCKLLGYSSCSFLTNGMNIKNAIQHFSDCHDSVFTEEDSIEIHLNDFPPHIVGCKTCSDACIPAILTVDETYFLIFIMFTRNKKYVSWVCIKLNNCDAPVKREYEVDFQISDRNGKGNPQMQRKIAPVDLMDAEKIVYLPGSVTQLREKHCNEDNVLKIYFRICPTLPRLGSHGGPATAPPPQGPANRDDMNRRTMQDPQYCHQFCQ